MSPGMEYTPQPLGLISWIIQVVFHMSYYESFGSQYYQTFPKLYYGNNTLFVPDYSNYLQ